MQSLLIGSAHATGAKSWKTHKRSHYQLQFCLLVNRIFSLIDKNRCTTFLAKKIEYSTNVNPKEMKNSFRAALCTLLTLTNKVLRQTYRGPQFRYANVQYSSPFHHVLSVLLSILSIHDSWLVGQRIRTVFARILFFRRDNDLKCSLPELG